MRELELSAEEPPLLGYCTRSVWSSTKAKARTEQRKRHAEGQLSPCLGLYGAPALARRRLECLGGASDFCRALRRISRGILR
jgi:hypothetical protein